MRATFVPSSRYRWAYLPRVPERMSSEGYSGRRSWSLLLIGLAFPAGHFPSWDEPESSAAVRERHDQVSVFEGSAEYDKALLIDGVVRVRSG